MPEISDKLHIRSATRDDVALILSLIKELSEYERLAHEVQATEEILTESLFGEHRYAEVLIASLGERPVGYALYFHSFSTFLGRQGMYLEDIYVRPAERGKGIGKALLARVAKLAVERRCGRLEWSVLNWNEPSIGFYKSLGAQPMDEWTVYRLVGKPLEQLASAAPDAGG